MSEPQQQDSDWDEAEGPLEHAANTVIAAMAALCLVFGVLIWGAW